MMMAIPTRSCSLASGRLRVLRNDGRAGNRSLRVRLAPRVSNRSAVGAKIDLRAGSLRQRLEVSPSTPAVRPADRGVRARPATGRRRGPGARGPRASCRPRLRQPIP